MSRRSKRANGRNVKAATAEPQRAPAEDPPARSSSPPRRHPWFLTAAILLEIAWLGFLLSIALAG